MVRNVILVISTLAILLLLFVGYSSLVGAPEPRERFAGQGTADLPNLANVSDEAKLQVETAEGTLGLSPGEPMAYVEYNHLGEPIRRYSFQSWQKVPGTRNDLEVTAPELMLRLPRGELVTISAARGRITADRADAQRLRPKFGRLDGKRVHRLRSRHRLRPPAAR